MKKTIEYLDFIIQQHEQTSKYMHQRDLSSIQLFCIGLLERLSSASLALKLLLENIHKNNSLEFSCGIILRSTLLDALIVLKLYSLLIENEESAKTDQEKESIIKDFCDTILSDGLENTLTYMKAAKDVSIINNQQYIDTLNNFAQKYQQFFQPYLNDGTVPVLKITKYYSPTILFKQIALNPRLKELSKLYDTYLFFSKYDHFGILYYEASRQNYFAQLDRIKKGIELFIGTNSILHLALRMYSNNDTILNNQSNLAAQYLHDNILNVTTNEENTLGTIY